MERQLELWTLRNEIQTTFDEPPKLPKKPDKPKRAFTGQTRPGCVYCSGEHKAVDCTEIVDTEARKKFLLDNRRCYNCTSRFHQVSNCSSKGTCVKCNERHHTSIHDAYQAGPKKVMATSNNTRKTIFPVTVVKVNGVTCRALIDSGPSSSYVSAKVAAMFGTKPVRTVSRTIEMLMNEKRVNLPIYKGNIVSMQDDFSMNVELHAGAT